MRIFNDKMADCDIISITEINNGVGEGVGGRSSVGDEQKPSIHEYESTI